MYYAYIFPYILDATNSLLFMKMSNLLVRRKVRKKRKRFVEKDVFEKKIKEPREEHEH